MAIVLLQSQACSLTQFVHFDFRAQLMNGTSMAAPNVAGSVALLISGLKQKGASYSTFNIKRALENTATQLSVVDPFAQGSGLLNVDKAFEYLMRVADDKTVNVRFGVTTDAIGSKGIHMRSGPLKRPEEFTVNIEPVFLNDKEVDPQHKVDFNVHLVLTPSAEWVQCGSFLDLCYAPRTINVRVDPTGLERGVHQAVIKAYDAANVELGHLFEIPITVVQPLEVTASTGFVFTAESQVFTPNTIARHFLQVPNFATWAILRMRATDDDVHKFFVHTMQILPLRYCNAMETQRIVTLSSESETLLPFKCEGNNVLEVCLAKYWSNLGSTTVTLSVEFHGIHPVSGGGESNGCIIYNWLQYSGTFGVTLFNLKISG